MEVLGIFNVFEESLAGTCLCNCQAYCQCSASNSASITNATIKGENLSKKGPI